VHLKHAACRWAACEKANPRTPSASQRSTHRSTSILLTRDFENVFANPESSVNENSRRICVRIWTSRPKPDSNSGLWNITRSHSPW
jgi:uncharacterized phage-associated protein